MCLPKGVLYFLTFVFVTNSHTFDTVTKKYVKYYCVYLTSFISKHIGIFSYDINIFVTVWHLSGNAFYTSIVSNDLFHFWYLK